jgi:DNA polymerase/3'-5' exonuclease PolX
MKTKYPAAAALAVANELKEILAPSCARIEIAGSLRRRRPVGDVELVFVPQLQDSGIDFFTPLMVSCAAEAIAELERKGVLRRRLNKLGHQTWGPENKLAVHVPSGIPVDFFSTIEEHWWVSLVIRTGGKATNLKLTTGAQKLGRKLNAYGAGITRWDMSGPGPREVVVQALSERHVFELCGVPHAPPHLRD